MSAPPAAPPPSDRPDQPAGSPPAPGPAASDARARPAAGVASAAAAVPSADVAARPRRALRWLLALALLAAATLAGLLVWRLRVDVDALQTRLAESERQLGAAIEQQAQRAREAQRALERLQAEVERLSGQRSELETLYLDLTRGRDEAALAEIERLVTLAAQELQLTGNVGAALAALQSADARLARLDRPQLVNLRRAITRDIERLRAVPAVDVTGLAVKLDQLAQGVDAWPLLAQAVARGEPARQPAPAAAPPAADAWARIRAWLKAEFGELVQVRRVDTPEALLLDAQQQQLARQQMRLRLLNARQAVLTRNDRLFRADLAEALALQARYFDLRQPAVAAAQQQLRQLAATTLSVDVPQIADALGALRQARPAAR